MKKTLLICLAIVLAILLISCDDSTSKKSGITPYTSSDSGETSNYLIKATITGSVCNADGDYYIKDEEDVFDVGYGPISYHIYSEPDCNPASEITDGFFIIETKINNKFSIIVMINESAAWQSDDINNTQLLTIGQNDKAIINKGTYDGFQSDNPDMIGGTISLEVLKDCALAIDVPC